MTEPPPSHHSKPQLNIHYSVPEFTPPHPDTIQEHCKDPNNLIFCHGVIILILSPTVAVKFGPHIKIIEAESMLYVARSTTVPVPKVFAYYTYGPIDRDLDDYGSYYDTYIFMTLVDGVTLDVAWDQLSDVDKTRISEQLAGYVQELRDMDGEGYIGSVNHGPVTDHSLSTSPDKGPFPTESSFNKTLIETYLKSAPKRHIKSFLDGMLPDTHRILFAHGDLRPPNIMVKDGDLAAIIDWELSGWYPEYWEFAKAFLIWGWQSDWTDCLMRALRPYHAEYFMHAFIMEKLLI
ncbi:aminoglycoside phosphotransferase family protein [Aspergillus melleus]|uniref:aminoglycoside phosphotransferase family protein n=1 Tax=Aspergillus melleus TaxID=138277 RepID=UPI001E8D4138|nr:uncharacterized protein LDX57_001705 [Aspergillus melleus]KAH8423949.1 hypothetical protein LDX57_001705 [Aspergillus melleus]